MITSLPHHVLKPVDILPWRLTWRLKLVLCVINLDKNLNFSQFEVRMDIWIPTSCGAIDLGFKGKALRQ